MTPRFLQQNDKIRIISPSGYIAPSYIDGATRTLNQWGLIASEGKSTRNAYGRFAGTDLERITDLQEAIDDPDTKAILCSRGGYGMARIIDQIDFSPLLSNPKWLIGFSDITVLHNVLTQMDIPSVHGIMAKHLTELPANSEQVEGLRKCLFGELPSYKIQGHPLNKTGHAKGKLIGGNLSILYALRGTSLDLPYKDNILFIEDIAEKPYHIDRMLQNLRLGGVFEQISGLVVGQFSDCDEDPLMLQTVAEIIRSATANYNFPVCFDFPAGHVDYNLPLIMGASTTLSITDQNASLIF